MPWWLKSKTVWFAVATAGSILLGAESIGKAEIAAVLTALGAVIGGRHAQQRSIDKAARLESLLHTALGAAKNKAP
jgi:hypothetical protein